ncbi:MAG TPA: hypothetical protein PLH94_11365 [Fimbriimonadaceae bacterium]|nr:hypothetical protein [Fimbriimonadaceae bacterium]
MGDIDRIAPPPPAIRIADHPHGLFVQHAGREGRPPKQHPEAPTDVIELHDEPSEEIVTESLNPSADDVPHLDISA